MSNNECITVVVRCRPMNRKENEENRKPIIQIDSENRQVSITNPEAPAEPPKSFTYDASYDENTQQRIFYEESCFNVIESTLEGFNSTIFAYGQTGCGKSFTMQGPSTTDENLRGVIPNSFLHIFQFVKSTKDIEFLIRCSYLELYNEEIRDLLGNPKSNVKCELKEDPNKGVYVKNLTDVVVESPEDLYKMLDKGLTNRTVASTLMNSESSRSHSIFTIVIEMNTKDPVTGKDMLRVGKLNLVDLAGSERAKKTGAKDQTLKEGIKINLSLSVLGNVISALSEGAKHIPYRDSKLTRLLQDSLGGNTKTMMVAAISPADYNYDETLSTLRYANRAKNIKNKPKINEDPKDTMIREFKAEIERLKKMLMEQSSASQILAQLGIAPDAVVAQQQQQQQQPGYNSGVASANVSHSGSAAAFAPVGHVTEDGSAVMSTQAGGHHDGFASQHGSSTKLMGQVKDAQQFQQQFLDEDRRQLEQQHQQHILERQHTLDQQQDALYQQHHHASSHEFHGAYSTEIRQESHTEGTDFEIEGSPVHLQPRPPAHQQQQHQPSPHHIQRKSQAHSHSLSPQKQSTAEDDEYADAGFESAEHTGEFSHLRVTTPSRQNATSAEMMLNNNPELEEQLRNELANRLSQLQQMLVTSHTEVQQTTTVSAVSSKLSPIKEVLGSTNGSIAEQYSPIKTQTLQTQKTQEEIDAEEAEAARIYRERKMKAKKKREEKLVKEAEMKRILDEKRMMEEELEELRASAASHPLSGVNTSREGTANGSLGQGSTVGGDGNSDAAKKMSKLKKRYEKKIQSMSEELTEMRDEFEYQRKQLLDNIVEQEKDLKLYELICKSLLSEKDFKKILDKCRYDEDNDEWIIPYIKKKQAIDVYGENTSQSTGNNNGYTIGPSGGGGGGGSSMLPDIHQKPNGAVKESENFDQTMKFNSAMTFNLGGGGSGGGTKKDKSRSSNNGSTGKIPVVPLLTLPGHLISASSLLDSSQSDRVESGGNSNNNTSSGAGYGYSSNGHNHGHDRSSARSDLASPYDFPAVSTSMPSGRGGVTNGSTVASNSLPGIGFEKKKNHSNNNGSGQSSSSAIGTQNQSHQIQGLAAVKAPNKIPKIPPSGNNKMPAIGGNHSYQDYGYDGDGSGGDHYQNDHHDDDHVPTSARVKKKKHRDREARGSRDVAPAAEPNSARGGGGSSSLPPIGMKHATPRLGGGGGGGLPPI